MAHTNADALHAERIPVHFDTAARGVRFKQVVDIIHIAVITATRLHALVESASCMGALRPTFDMKQVPPLKDLRRRLNQAIGAGGISARIRDFARRLNSEKYAFLHVPVAHVLPPALSAALEQVHDEIWLPSRAEFWEVALKLRDGANAGDNQAAALRTDKIFVAFRTHTSAPHRHVHENVALETRRRCILGCEVCPTELDHYRKGPHSTFMCKRCGVVLSYTKRAEFGNRSAWDVFHNDEVLPTHPYTGLSAAASAAAASTGLETVLTQLDAQPASHSSKKRRNAKKFKAAVLDVGATRMNLMEKMGDAGGPSGAWWRRVGFPSGLKKGEIPICLPISV